MKTIFFSVLCGVAILAAGCVQTVSERRTAAVPFVRDRAEAKYPRPVDQVFDAARYVVAQKGAVTRESNLVGYTNTVRVLEGKVNQRDVWIRIEAVDPKITAVTIQVRTSGGAPDQPLAYQLDKEIALQLAR